MFKIKDDVISLLVMLLHVGLRVVVLFLSLTLAVHFGLEKVNILINPFSYLVDCEFIVVFR